MPKTLPSITPTAALNYETTLVIVVETSKSSWVIGAQVPGFPQTKAKQKIAASAPALETARRSNAWWWSTKQWVLAGALAPATGCGGLRHSSGQRAGGPQDTAGQIRCD
jgi:hypothetical protein